MVTYQVKPETAIRTSGSTIGLNSVPIDELSIPGAGEFGVTCAQQVASVSVAMMVVRGGE
jgi:hypothetical protein